MKCFSSCPGKATSFQDIFVGLVFLGTHFGKFRRRNVNLGSKPKLNSLAALLPVDQGFILLRKMELFFFFALGVNIIAQIKYEKIPAISQGYLSQTPQGKCL